MEGIIQYRLLGNHPAASGRYLTIGFPGETTTAHKLMEQVIQEHRINMSRYKLEVCKLVPEREAPGGRRGGSGAASSPSSPNASSASPSGNDATSADGQGGDGSFAFARDALVSIVIPPTEELRTYDRLTITVSKRQLADDEATRKEQEQLERQRRIREMEEQLLQSNSGMLDESLQTAAVLGGGIGVGSNPASPPPPPTSSFSMPVLSYEMSGRTAAADGTTTIATAATAAGATKGALVDPLRLQRAATLASQLFPIRKGQRSALGSLDDSANTHQCVLCRLPAFEEVLTSCCHFPVCRSCYSAAAEMDMEEGQCPVCGTPNALDVANHYSEGDDRSLAVGSALGSLKRSRDGDGEGRSSSSSPRGGWKREDAADSKVLVQRALGLQGGEAGDTSHDTADRQRWEGPADVPGAKQLQGVSTASASLPSAAAASAVSKDVQQTEERLRRYLEKAFAILDGPDPIPASAKAKRVISAELRALCEQ